MVNPVGYRFQPTHSELVSYFLRMKRLDPAFSDPTIKEVNIYKYHPCELPGLSSIGSDEQVWYFFCILDRKYAKSERPSRTAKGGSWKKTGIDRPVKDKDSNKQIGIKKTLVFYKGCNTRKENKTNWTMHEYHEYPCKKNSYFKGEVVVCRIEKKTDKKHEPSSALDEEQPSDILAYDSVNNVARDIPQVEPQPPQHVHLPSSSNNNNVMELESQLLPNQHMSPTIGDHVATYVSPELESQLLPKQHVSPIIGDHVAKATTSQLESQLLLPNFHASSTIEDHLKNNSFSRMEPQLLPNQHTSSNFEDCVAESMFFEIESQHLANHHMSSNTENHAAKSFPLEVPPLLPAQQDELIAYNGLDHNSFSTLQPPIYPTPGSSYSSSFSNDLAHLLNHNSFSALQSPFHILPGSPYSSSFNDNSTNEQDLNSFSTLQPLSHPQPGSSYSRGFRNYPIDELDYNSFSALQFPIHPVPESSYSNSFSNASTNGPDHCSVSARQLQSPIYPQPASSYSTYFSNDSNVWAPLFTAEQEDDLANSHRSVQDDFSFPETGHTFSPVFNSSKAKAVAGGYVGHDGSDAVIETVSAWPNEY